MIGVMFFLMNVIMPSTMIKYVLLSMIELMLCSIIEFCTYTINDFTLQSQESSSSSSNKSSSSSNKNSSSSSSSSNNSNIGSSSSSSSTPGCVIEATFFPLLAVLIPKWLAKCDKLKKKIVFIISGRGTPNDANSSMQDNSTKFMGILATKFLEREYPQVTVIHIHSATNIFRYDENIAFVKR